MISIIHYTLVTCVFICMLTECLLQMRKWLKSDPFLLDCSMAVSVPPSLLKKEAVMVSRREKLSFAKCFLY